MYNSPKSVFQQKLRESLDTSTSGVIQDLLRLSLLKVAEKDENLVVFTEIFNLLGVEQFTALISLIDGKTLSFPTKVEFKDTITTVLCYYYRQIENKDWDEIKKLLGDPDLNTIKFGIRASSFGAFLTQLTERIRAAS